jgi:hypothetical protein
MSSLPLFISLSHCQMIGRLESSGNGISVSRLCTLALHLRISCYPINFNFSCVLESGNSRIPQPRLRYTWGWRYCCPWRLVQECQGCQNSKARPARRADSNDVCCQQGRRICTASAPAVWHIPRRVSAI